MGIRFEGTRYVIGATGVFVGIWLILGPFIRSRRIRTRQLPPKMLNRQVRTELLNSFRTICVFVAIDIFIFDMAEAGLFRFYETASEYGAAYYWTSIGLGILFHDAYFYWTHHDMHHEKGSGNFGLYFTWWDRLMGTEHEAYHARFEDVTGRRDRARITA